MTITNIRGSSLPVMPLLVLCIFISSCGRSGNVSKADLLGPATSVIVPVAVAKPSKGAAPVFLHGVGTVTAYNTVTIKSRVDGQIVQIAFEEGQNVRKGDLLIVVDPQPYQALLEQARATLSRDQASLQDAHVVLQRQQDLYAASVISKQQLQAQAVAVAQLEGTVRADQAQVDSAALNLSYTRISSPIAGRVGLRLVDSGNMVRASDTNGLVVVTQIHPIAVLFVLPEQVLAKVASYMQQTAAIQVAVFAQDDQTELATGRLLTFDNQIDPATNTAKFKAVFDNSNNLLWPNEAVNIRLFLDNGNAVVVPAAAIHQGPKGTFAYVVKKDNTVEARPVSVTTGSENGGAVVAYGLKSGELIIVESQPGLHTGLRVAPKPLS